MKARTTTSTSGRKKTSNKSAQTRTPDGITLKQERAIAAILEGRTIEAAMKKARLARSTFYEWLKDDRFREELNARRKYLFQSALDDLKALLGDSVHELQRLILYYECIDGRPTPTTSRN